MAMGRGRLGAMTVVAIVLAACASEADDVSGVGVAERFEPNVPITDEVYAIGDALFAVGSGDDDVHQLTRSLDLGATWNAVELPGAPELADVGLTRPVPDRDLLVVTGWVPGDGPASGGGADPGGDTYVWTTSDGVAWHGGHLPGGLTEFEYLDVFEVDDVLVGELTSVGQELGESGEVRLFRSTDDGASWEPAGFPDLAPRAGETFGLVRDGWRADDGRLVLRLLADGNVGGPEVLESRDDGATWQPGSCPEEMTGEDGRCSVARYGSLLVDGHEVSGDNGATWHRPDIRSERDLDQQQEIPIIDDVVELDGGGWLASPTNTEPGDETYGFLLRSEDGHTWEQVIPDSCRDEVTDDRGSSSFSRPLRVPGGWLVSYGCSGLWSGHVYSELYLLDEEGRDPRLVVGSRTSAGESYRAGFVLGGAVIVPISSGEDETSLVRVDL